MVFLCILILTVDFMTAFYVLLTVSITLVDIVGFAYFWNMDIDTSFIIFMTLSIGLCVDYTVETAHGFLIETGSRWVSFNTRGKRGAILEITKANWHNLFLSLKHSFEIFSDQAILHL